MTRRLLALLAVAAAVAGAAARPADAGRECDGLIVCIPVAGPWVQVLGGAGIMRDHPVEKWLRDAKVLQIVEGTSEIQRHVIVQYLVRAPGTTSS